MRQVQIQTCSRTVPCGPPEADPHPPILTPLSPLKPNPHPPRPHSATVRRAWPVKKLPKRRRLEVKTLALGNTALNVTIFSCGRIGCQEDESETEPYETCQVGGDLLAEIEGTQSEGGREGGQTRHSDRGRSSTTPAVRRRRVVLYTNRNGAS